MKALKRLTIPCLILIFSLSAFGLRRIDQSAGPSGVPAVAVNQDGVVLIVWCENAYGDGNAGTLYYVVNKDGEWSPPRDIGITKIIAWTPQLDIDSEGNFHLAYCDGASRLNREIYYAKYDPDSGWSNAEMIYNSPENSAWQKISVDNETVHIAWFHEHVDPYLGSDIVTIAKNIDATFWPSLYERLSYTAHELTIHPAFKVRDGKIFVCYMEGTGLKLPWKIYYKEAMSGSNWQNIQPVRLTDLGYYPEMAVDDKENVHVVWSAKNGNFNYRSRINGTWRAQEVISNKFSPLQFGDIQHRNNILVATWVQQDSLGISTYYAKKTTTGQWEKPIQIAQGSDCYAARVWLDNQGYGHFVWEDAKRIFYEKIQMPFPDPYLQLSHSSFSFTIEGQNPDPVTISVKNIGEKALNYKVQVDKPWLTVTPTSGKLSKDEEDELLCTIDAGDLEEGSYTGTIEITSAQAINSPQTVTVKLEVLAPPIYPPLDFSGEVLQNKALFYIEYIHKLTWNPEPKNKNITNYRIYEVDGVNHIFLEELPASTLEYTRRYINKNKSYNYELWAVDDKGRTGDEPAKLIIGAAVVSKETVKSGRVSIKK
jgi:hypothetical protein